MKYFFLFLSKTDHEVLRHCPQSSLNNQVGLGIFVLFTGIFAFISGSYALSMVFIETGPDGRPLPLDSSHIIMACGFGMLYSFMIMAIDREIVSATKQGSAFLRIPLAIMIGFIVAVPLELKLMEGKINTQLRENQIEKNNKARQGRSDSIRNRYDAECMGVKEEINKTKEYIIETEINLDAEEVGRQVDGRTGVPGKGTSFTQLKENYSAAQTRLYKAERKLDSLNSIKDEMEKEALAAFKDDSVMQTFGLMDRYVALQQVIEQDETGASGTMSCFLTVFFILLELIPALMKTMLSPSEYDAAIETRRRLNLQMSYSIGRAGMEEMEKNVQNAIQKPSYMSHIWENIMR